MAIIDTHVHIVSPDRTRYPRQPGVTQSAWYDETPATAEDLLREMDRAGVYGAVLVQAHGPYAFDNSYCADARGADPRRLVSSSIVDFNQPGALDQLTYWARERHMASTRVFHLPPPDRPWLADRAHAPLWARIEELGVRPHVCLVRRHLPVLGELLAWVPCERIALDHCGLIEMAGYQDQSSPLDQLIALAEFPQLYLKVSTFVLDLAPALGLAPAALVRRLADGFGAERLMWSSDWPQTHHLSYVELVAQGRAATAELSEAEAEWFLGATARSLWPELAP